MRPNSRSLFQFEFMLVADRPAGGVITAAINGPSVIETDSPQLALDASASSSPNTGSLTYSWTVALGYLQAAILNADTPTPTIQVCTCGLHQFTVTVTDNSGATSSATGIVRYI